jgi:hypothetical protein
VTEKENNMRHFYHLILALVLTVGSMAVNADTGKRTYRFEKGQVIDFLFLTNRPNSEEAFRAYAQAAISEARALDYKGLGGFSITRKPTQGNYYPETLIFGGWPGDFDDRASALAQLKKAVPELNSMRLDIWSTFYMTNYQIDEEISFDVSYDKIQVLTAYWQKDEQLFAKFKQEFMQKIKASGGDLKWALTGGRSPFGYEYTPDYTVIAEWENQMAFDAFLKSNLAMDHAGVKHVNQFYLTLPAPRK